MLFDIRLEVPRLSGHSFVDTQSYKSPELRKTEESHDTLPKLESYMKTHHMTAAEWDALVREVEQHVRTVADEALATPAPDTSIATKHIFSPVEHVITSEQQQPAPGAPAVPAAPTGGVFELPVEQIQANKRQPRTVFADEPLDSLAASIKEVGVLQPVVVRRVGDGYELIAGERRLRAAKKAGLEKIPVILRKSDDAESLREALIENIHRENLNPIELAESFHTLLEELGLKQETLAERLGVSRPHIANTIRLLQLPGDVQQMLTDGRLQAGHGRALLSLGEQNVAAQKSFALRAVAEGLSVRGLEDAVRGFLDVRTGGTTTIVTFDSIRVLLTDQNYTGSAFLDAYADAQISGYLFRDRNGNGTQDEGEGPVVGMNVYVDDNSNAVYDVGESFGTTDSLGNWLIPSLLPGTHRPRVDVPSGWVGTGTLVRTVTAISGSTVSGGSFSVRRSDLSIAGTVYDDANANGTIEGARDVDGDGVIDIPAETGLAAVTVAIYRDTNGNGIWDGASTDLSAGSTTTDAAGAFAFTGIFSGTYFVIETDPTNFASTNAVPGGGGAIKDSSNRFLVVLTSSSSTNNQFLDTNAQGSISGYVYNDLNGNGKADSTKRATDAPLAGSVISLYRDRGSLGVLEVGVTGAPDELVATVTVGAAGTWTFTGLIYDTYLVTQSTITTGYGATGVDFMRRFQLAISRVIRSGSIWTFLRAAMLRKYKLDIGLPRAPLGSLDQPWTDDQIVGLLALVDGCDNV